MRQAGTKALSMPSKLFRAVPVVLSLMGGPALAVEEPAFTSVLKQGDFEVRDYPALVAAEVIVPGDQGDAASSGFRLLTGYIFGGNNAKTKIAMTAPVVQVPSAGETIAMTAPATQSGSPAGWTIRFIMPRNSTLESLPVPNDQQVKLNTLPAMRVAVVRFSGLGRAGDVADRTAELQGFMAQQKLMAVGPACVARYDPPWTPWFMRRNEIMYQIKPIS